MADTDYEYITAILEAGNITKAAKKLFISQSALSQYIKRIEGKFGIEIIDRDYSPLRLTEAGEIFYESLEEIASIEEEALNQIEELNKLQKGEIVVGCTDYLEYSLLSKVLKGFNKTYPGIAIKLLEGKTSELNQAALVGKCDFSISYAASPKNELTNIKLYEEEVYVALNRNNPAVADMDIAYPQVDIPTIDAKKLKYNKIIGTKKGQNLRYIFSQINKYTDNTLETILETDSMYLAKKFVAEDLGISLVPANMARDNTLEECVFVKISPQLNKRIIMIHYNATRRLKKPAKILIDMLINYAKENFDKEGGINGL